MKTLSILYRGALETCNYACHYCPFAKRKETKQKKSQDTKALQGFVDWVAEQTHLSINLFFTPWGEALVFKRYQEAIQTLSRLAHLKKIVVQTNLSTKLDFLADVDCRKLKLWCTYHPSEVSRAKFISQTEALTAYGVEYSVGMVAEPKLFEEISALRKALNSTTYLWLNAYVEGNRHYLYNDKQQVFLTHIDPYFAINAIYKSEGEACYAGENVISVDEQGAIRRCHFIDEKLGNIYQADWQQVLQARNCSNKYCDCYIGYSHLKSLQLGKIYGEQSLERIALTF